MSPHDERTAAFAIPLSGLPSPAFAGVESPLHAAVARHDIANPTHKIRVIVDSPRMCLA